MDQSAVAAILILHRTANRVVAKIGGRTPSQSSTLTPAVSRTAFQRANSRPMCWPLTGSRADRTLTVQHVGVAPFIVNNNPETMERGRRSFLTAAGWSALMLRSIAPDLGFTRDRALQKAQVG